MPNTAILSWMLILTQFVADFHLPISDMFYKDVISAQGKPSKCKKQF
jgi:hypothetical protein